jgi:hypothetical protein
VSLQRRAAGRRRTERKAKPGDAVDVSRIEYENLAAEVTKNARVLARIEQEVIVLREVISRLRTKRTN